VAVLAIGADDRIVRGEDRHGARGHPFLSYIEVKKATDLTEAVQLRRLLLESANTEHVPK
jgi:hypothetical protein